MKRRSAKAFALHVTFVIGASAPALAQTPAACDALAALKMIAAQIAQGATVRTRPLCVYPQVAKWNGAGSQDDAANFTCKQP